ncbi:MAG TPA: class I SAM-dependent methyltransferase [Stellaceae bacterium]|nr:class I SAM-dependent methyltransferase [Stellaceae bacterium]
MSEGFGLDWLRLREGQDMRARSRTLARGFGAAVRRKAGDAPALLVDLGAGSGAGFRALAPLIAGDQEWRLVDHDRALLGHQAAEIAQWARGQGYRVTHGMGVVTVATGRAHWRAHSIDRDLAAGLESLSLSSAHGVACAALLDLVSESWLRALADRLASSRVPFLAALSVDGRREWRPEHGEDALVLSAFARHQVGDKGFGTALGPEAPRVARAVFEERGYGVMAAPADWRLDAVDDALLAALVDGDAAAAAESEPAAASRIAKWRADRHAARAEGTLRLTVGHVDILAVADESG